MAIESNDIWTHGTGNQQAVHAWEYLGRKAQEYRCKVCQSRVTKAEMKEETDA